jgi:hypothetical protein
METLILVLSLLFGQCIGAFIGIILGLLTVWLIILPALYYREWGFWWIAFVREDPPDEYEYQGPYERPLFKKKGGSKWE